MPSPYNSSDEKMLMTELWDPAIADDPEAYVMFAFPWEKENTPLHDQKGPRAWQREEMQMVAQHVRDNKERMDMGLSPQVYKSATVSGRGPGKSTLFSWLTLWHESCHIGASTVVTANTEGQLKTKTWAELGKWKTLAINGHWFEKQALSLKPEAWFREALEKQLKIDSTYYYAEAQLWSEENTDAFAGAHNQAGMMVIFDEASGIHEKIWDVTEGFFTDKILHRYWFVFSNPRRNTGRFFECFHSNSAYWKTRVIDARSVEGADIDYLNSIIKQHGEDSDTAKIEVKGQFPSQGDKQFIAREIVDGAVEREIIDDDHAPLMMGVDPARFGDDKSVIRFRQGRNGKVIPAEKYSGLDNMQLANRCAFLIAKYNPDAVCIDAGNGTGVIDRLREMGYKVFEVWFGSKSAQPEYANKRTEMWADCREWLKGACIDNDPKLKSDLVGPEYGFMGRSDQIMLESKERMKQRGLKSPDDADALVCTFAVKPARRDSRSFKGARRERVAKGMDYNVFGE